MKTFHILKKKTFSKLHHPVAAALLVSSLSIVAGAGTMAALADNPYYSYSSSSSGSSYSRSNSSSSSCSTHSCSSSSSSGSSKSRKNNASKKSSKRKSKGNAGNTTAGMTTRRISINRFNTLSLSNAIDVVYRQGPATGYAEIHGDPKAIDCLNLSDSNGSLNIGYRSSPGNINGATVVYVTNPTIDAINLNDACNFTSIGTIDVGPVFNIHSSGASTIDIPDVTGDIVNILTDGAGKVNISSANMNIINTDANGASSIKIKEICAQHVNSISRDAASISVAGRCNYKNSITHSVRKLNERGLIIESRPLDCSQKSRGRIPPRQP